MAVSVGVRVIVRVRVTVGDSVMVRVSVIVRVWVTVRVGGVVGAGVGEKQAQTSPQVVCAACTHPGTQLPLQQVGSCWQTHSSQPPSAQPPPR